MEEFKEASNKKDQAIVDKNVMMAKMQEEMEEIKTKYKSELESMKKEIERRTEEVAILKAKVYLD